MELTEQDEAVIGEIIRANGSFGDVYLAGMKVGLLTAAGIADHYAEGSSTNRYCELIASDIRWLTMKQTVPARAPDAA